MVACLLGVALAVPAIAQSGGSVTQYPACPDPPPRLSPAELDAAHAAYKVGVEAYQTGDYQKALDNLKEAFRRDCSKVILLDAIAKSYEGLGNRADAIHALETYLQRNPKAPDAETVQNRIRNLRALMQQQTTATATETTTATTTATVTATATAVPTVTATATMEPRPHTVAPWIVFGVGLAAVIGGGALAVGGGVEFSNAHSEYTKSCLGVLQPAECQKGGVLQSQEDDGNTFLIVGSIIGGVGIVAMVGGLVWHFTERTTQKKVAIVPVLGPGYAGLSFGMPF